MSDTVSGFAGAGGGGSSGSGEASGAASRRARLIGSIADLAGDFESLAGDRLLRGEIRSVAVFGAASGAGAGSALLVVLDGASFLLLERVAMNLSQ